MIEEWKKKNEKSSTWIITTNRKKIEQKRICKHEIQWNIRIGINSWTTTTVGKKIEPIS